MSKNTEKNQTTDTNKEPSSFHRYLNFHKESLLREKEELQDMDSFWKKFNYIFYYHKWHFLIAFILIFVLVYTAHAIATKKEYAYECVVINDSYNDEFQDTLKNTLDKTMDYDHKKEKIVIGNYSTDIRNYDPGYYGGDAGMQNIFYEMSDCLIDSMIANEDVAQWFAKDDNFYDLDTLLSSEEYKDLEPYMIKYEDSSGKEHAFALDISQTDFYKKGKSNLKSPRLCIFNTTSHAEESVAFIKEIFELN